MTTLHRVCLLPSSTYKDPQTLRHSDTRNLTEPPYHTRPYMTTPIHHVLICQFVKEENLCEYGKTSRWVPAEAVYCPDAVEKGNYINNTLQRCGQFDRGSERSTIVKDAYCDSWDCKQKASAREGYKCCQCNRVNPRVSNTASSSPTCECGGNPCLSCKLA